MKVSEQYAGEYLKAADLRGKTDNVQIDGITRESLGDEDKLVLSFTGKSQRMVLNKTNANTIADLLGDETDGWIGKGIALFPTKTDYSGRQVDCIRVRATETGTADNKDDVPF